MEMTYFKGSKTERIVIALIQAAALEMISRRHEALEGRERMSPSMRPQGAAFREDSYGIQKLLFKSNSSSLNCLSVHFRKYGNEHRKSISECANSIKDFELL